MATVNVEIGADQPIDEDYRGQGTQKRVVDKLVALFKAMKRMRRETVERVWEASHDAYFGLPPKDNRPYRTAYPLKEIFKQVEILKPLMADRLLPGPRFEARFIPRSADAGLDERADAAFKIITAHEETFGIEREKLKWLDNTWVWGVSYLQLGWQTLKQTRRKITKAKNMEDGRSDWLRETTDFVQEGPKARALDHWSVYTDPRVEQLEDSPAVFIWEKVSSGYLKTMAREPRNGFDRDNVRKALLEKAAPDEEAANGEKTALEVAGADNRVEVLDDDYRGLLTCYTNDGWVFNIVDGKFLVRAQRNELGWLPILCLKDYPIAGGHYGLGEPAILLWDQALLTDACSMYADAMHYNLNPMRVVQSSERKNWELAKFKPGGVVYMTDITLQQPLATQNSTFDLERVMQTMRSNMQIVGGISDVLAGATRHRTATGIMELRQAAMGRPSHKVSINLPVMREYYRRMYDLEARFLNEEVALRMVGPDGRRFAQKYGPDTFEADVDVEIELPPEALDPQQRVGQAVQLWQIAAGDPRFRAQPLLLNLLRAFNVPEPERAVANPALDAVRAKDENAIAEAEGSVGPVDPQDNHTVHLQIHAGLPEEIGRRMTTHIQGHLAFLQQQAQAAGAVQALPGMAQPQGEGQSLPAEQIAAQRTEQRFGNGMTGGLEALGHAT